MSPKSRLSVPEILEIEDDNLRRVAAALDAAMIGVFEFEPATGRAFWDERVRAMWNVPAGENITYETVIAQVHPDDRALHNEATEAVLDPNGSGHMNMEYRLQPRGSDKTLWVKAEADCSFKDGVPVRLIGTVQDITSRKEAELRNEMLTLELRHRVKNTLATVLAVVKLSRRGHSDFDTYADALDARIEALAKSHDILRHNDWREVPLSTLAKDTFKGLLGDDTRLQLSGRYDPIIPEHRVLTFSLALHELATNALKHGALSVPQGCVQIETACEDAQISVVWTETGGPTGPAEFSSSGFGSLLLRRVLAPEFDGQVSYENEGEGAVFRLRYPQIQENLS